MASAFRKIDIDIYDEDVLQESELYDADPRDASQTLAEAKQKQAAVRTSLARWVFVNPFNLLIGVVIMCRSDIAGALATILDNPPYGPHVEQAKVCVWPSQIASAAAHVHLLNSFAGTDAPDSSHNSQHYQSHGNSNRDQIVDSGSTRYTNEVSVQGYGYARVGRHQW